MFTNPTGGGIRNDSIGNGFWQASRGSSLHKGIDLLLPRGVGQGVVAPHEGIMLRYSLPYSKDQRFSGILLRGNGAESKLWYLLPNTDLLGTQVRQGQLIGVAQDISLRYGSDCQPHIHWQVEAIDPASLI